jgi:thiol-disulfide isomerase/thioredoxin
MAATSTMLPLGSQAPSFDLPEPGDGRHRLQNFDGAPGLLVMFLCNHCPYVKHVNERLAEITRRWIDQGLAVVGINSNDVSSYPDDAPERMVAVAAAVGYPFPYLFDEDQSVALGYRAACTPDFFLFDAQQRLVYRGRFDESRPGSGVPVSGSDLAAAVDAVLGGTPVPEDQRPSIGCSIKWKAGNEPN